MKSSELKQLIREEVKNVLKEHSEHDNYMFFQNLHTMKRMIDKMLQLNRDQVDELLSNGHAWAVDHISTSTDDVTEVGQWLCNELSDDQISISHMNTIR